MIINDNTENEMKIDIVSKDNKEDNVKEDKKEDEFMNQYVNIYNINFSDFIPKSENDDEDFINDFLDEGTELITREKVPAPIPDEIPQIKNNQPSENNLTATLYTTEDHPCLSTLVKHSNAYKMVQKSETVCSERGST